MRAISVIMIRAEAIFAVALLALPAPALAVQELTQDEAVLAARDAFNAGDRVKLGKLAGKLDGHVLDSYLEYWRLRLENAPAGEVRAFLASNPGTPLAELLRREWLKLLGSKGQWDLFRAEYPALAGDDPEVACYALQDRWERQEPAASAEFRNFWNAPRELPEGCARIADAMLKAGRLGVPEIWNRFRILTDANLTPAARRLMESLPRDQALDGKRISAVARSPVEFLRNPQADLSTTAGRELAILALSQAAHSDPQLAVRYWDGKLREAFSPQDRGYVWGMLATHGARAHLPEALDWFDEIGNAPQSEEQLVWRARIALRQENWIKVKAAIERMSPLAKNDPAWIYWLGRAERALGNPSEAQALFARVAGEHHYYGLLAADELGAALQVPPRTLPPTSEELAEVAEIPGLQRALALYRADLRAEGTLEWIWSIRGMDDRRLLAAAELARRNEVWDRAIGTADRTVATHDFSVRYLAPYRDVLAQHARARELEENWVLGVVRQESRFVADARSSSGATGLMQVMRSTAQWSAMKLRMKQFNRSRLSEPDVNATLGTYYLRYVLNDGGGSPVLAAAAYNAGPTRARRWRGTRPLEGAIFIETIPFGETRDYVKKVMANTVYYAAVLSGESVSLKPRLGTIPPRSPANGLVAMRGEPAR